MRVKTPVSYDVARERALAVLTNQPLVASSVGQSIWPDSTLRAQGLGGAAARILKRMEREGLCRWKHDGTSWGWVRNGRERC